MFGKSQEQNDSLEWNNLTPSQKDLVTKSILRIRVYRFALLAALTLFSLLQSPISNYYASRSKEKELEISKFEKILSLQQQNTENALANVLNLSTQIGELKAQNEAFRKRIAELESEIKTLRNQ